MAALDENRFAFLREQSDRNPYSVRRSLAIIAGLSLSFWGLVGLALYEVL